MKIKNVVVIGSGTMGSGIAAHLCNANIPVTLLDLKTEISKNARERIHKSRPPLLIDKTKIDNIKVGNISDDFDVVKDADWIVEAVVERIDIKHQIYDKIFESRKDGAIVSSNTSSIPIKVLSQNLNKDQKKDFCITHFFNPPRYMKLVEFIYSNLNSKELISEMAQFMEDRLGKGIVYAKDTPNFIANRIGVFGMMVTVNEAIKRKINIEDVDALTGTIIGRPKSATFRTADVVGLDVMQFVANTAYNKCKNDKYRDQYVIPEKVKHLIDNECLGQKSGAGFYKKIDNSINCIITPHIAGVTYESNIRVSDFIAKKLINFFN